MINLNSCTQAGEKFYYEGFKLIDKKQFKDAIGKFNLGIAEKDIYKYENLYGRSKCYYELGKYKKSKKDVRVILANEDRNNNGLNSKAYWMYGMLAEVEGNHEKELELYEKALEYLPDDNRLNLSYALILIEFDRNQEGVRLLDKVIKKGIQHSYAYNNRALGLIKLKRFEEAKRDLEKAIKLDKDNPFIYWNYFLLYLELGNIEEACINIDIAISKKMNAYGLPSDIKKLKKLKKENCLDR